jgi:hypothetical protein
MHHDLKAIGAGRLGGRTVTSRLSVSTSLINARLGRENSVSQRKIRL